MQSVIALLLSLFIACCFYLTIDQINTVIIRHLLRRSTFSQNKTVSYLDSFEAYVNDNEINSSDERLINRWLAQNKSGTLIVYISKDGQVVYDSLQSYWAKTQVLSRAADSTENTDQSSLVSDNAFNGELSHKTDTDIYVGENYGDNSWFLKREIEFADGTASVSMYGYFDEWVYNLAWIAEIIMSFVLCCIVFTCFLQRKIKYVIKLEKDIKVIETGGLDYEVEEQGNDELSSLANGLNQMRIALADNINTESKAVKANYDLVVEVSHDLRTPLTSLGLYLDLIRDGKYENDEQMNSYIQKCCRKVTQIKQMSDQLFERFYLTKEQQIILESPMPPQSVFEDYLSNLCGYLDVNEFITTTSLSWTKNKLSVSTDYTSRIFENIASNIVKYADHDKPIDIKAFEKDGMFILKFTNAVRILESHPESSQVGVKNIAFMMEKMNGRCEVEKKKDEYCIALYFSYLQH